eukprot:scaffold3499_cov247-Pinguiococcus_pyrenoidosus.AAC.11
MNGVAVQLHEGDVHLAGLLHLLGSGEALAAASGAAGAAAEEVHGLRRGRCAAVRDAGRDGVLREGVARVHDVLLQLIANRVHALRARLAPRASERDRLRLDLSVGV